jgi:hypothetical protein
MAGQANVRNGYTLRFLIYMEAASIQINPMGTLERRMATGALSDDQSCLRADTWRNRGRIPQTAVHRMALARPSRKIARIAGSELARSIAIFSRARGLACRRFAGQAGGSPRALGKGCTWGSQPAIPTKRNSVMISIAQKAAKYRNGS